MINKFCVFVVGALLILSLGIFSGFYFFEDDEFMNLISGNIIREKVIGFYEASSVDDKILFLVQFIVGIVVIVLIFLAIKRLRTKRAFSKQSFMEKGVGRSRTDLDTLYEILKQKKEIGMADIEKVFKVDSDIAFGWAKILENGDLAVIDYPRFGKPVLRLVENYVEEGERKDREDKEVVKMKEQKSEGVEQVAKVKKKVGEKVMKKVVGRSKAKKVIKKVVGQKKVVKKTKKKMGKR